MTDKENKDLKPERPDDGSPEEKVPKGSSNLMKYLIFGAAGLVIVLGVAFGVSMFLGGSDDKAQVEEVAEAKSEQSDHKTKVELPKPGLDKSKLHKENTNSEETQDHSINSEDESSQASNDANFDEFEVPEVDEDNAALDKIMANLEFLDYQPETTEAAMPTETFEVVSSEDSLKEVNWIKSEKERLTKKEADLEQREADLLKLEQSVNSKLTKIEQATSSRVTQLAKLYDNMDSKSVAKLMMSLDDKTVVAILPRMKNKNAAEVLQLMPSQRAASLSKQLITIAEN